MRYPGGKGKCYQRIINMMPPHRVYIETHLGGGAVFRHKRAAELSIGIDIDPRVIAFWRTKSHGCELHQADAADYLESHEFLGDELVYCDPPYMAETRHRKRVYRYDYDEADHSRLLKVLTELPCKVIISGYACKLYSEILANWETYTFPAKTHTTVREETLWLNFESPSQLHDARYLGDTFRERQSNKRRFSRLLARLEQMRPLERNELMREIIAKFGPEAEQAPCKLG